MSERLEPKVWANVQEVVLGGEPGELGEWVSFELPIRDDFKRIWGVVPEGYEYVSFLVQNVWIATQ